MNAVPCLCGWAGLPPTLVNCSLSTLSGARDFALPRLKI